MIKYFVLLAALLPGLSCSIRTGDAVGALKPGAQELAAAALKMVRMEQRTMIAGESMTAAQAQADSLFLAAIKLDPACVRQATESGQGDCTGALMAFLAATDKLPAEESADDPAAAIRELVQPTARKNPLLLDGYLASFLMNMEIERDGTVLQDLMPFVVQGLGCPMSFRDLGIEGGIPKVEEMGATAASVTGPRPYGITPEDYVMALIKQDSWGSKFSGEFTADSLAARVIAEPWFDKVRPRLESLDTLRLVFFGDSHMDKIHWSTVAPFPEIIRAVFARINPRVTVLNAGRGGDDSGEALARLSPEIVGAAPEMAFVMFGGNDCRHYERTTPAVSPEQYVINIGGIVSRFKSVGGSVVLMETTHSPGEMSGADRETFGAICDSLHLLPSRLGTGWINVGGTLAKEPPSSVFARDMIHMCPDGHLMVTRLILESDAWGK